MTNRNLAILFLATVFGVQIFAILGRVDSWPLSSYPMFSQKASLAGAGAYKVTVENSKGESIDLQMNTEKLGWSLYHEPIVAENWAAVRDQVLRDVERNRALKPNLDLSHPRRITLYWVSHQEGTAPLEFKRTVLLTVDPRDNSFDRASYASN